MSKRNRQKRHWIGKMKVPQTQEIWLEEDDELREYMKFIEKLHPETTFEESIQHLVELGFISVRTNAAGKREYKYNRSRVQAELAKLPPDRQRKDPITIHYDTAEICDFNNDMTTLLEVVVAQTDKLPEGQEDLWIERTLVQLQDETFGIKDIPQAFINLQDKNFVEIAPSKNDTFRYRLNVPVVQAAIDALAEKKKGEQP